MPRSCRPCAQRRGWRGVAGFVETYLDTLADAAGDSRWRYYHAHVEDDASRHRLARMREQLLLPLEHALAEATERGEVCAGDPAADARRTYNLLEGLLYSVLWSGRHEDAVAVKRSVLSFLHRAFGVAEPGR